MRAGGQRLLVERVLLLGLVRREVQLSVDTVPSETKRASRDWSFAWQSLVVAVAIVVDTTAHELAHLAAARVAGVPAHFFALTGVGIPEAEVAKYSRSALAFMNAAGPVVEFALAVAALFALGTRVLRRSSPLRFFVLWFCILGLPAIALQLGFVALPGTMSGHGSDGAAVALSFQWSPRLRLVATVLSYPAYFATMYWMARALVLVETREPPAPLPGWRKIVGGVVLATGWILSVRATHGVLFALGEQVCIGAGAALLTPWRSAIGRYCRRLLLTGLLGSILVVPLGIADGGDDYVVIALFLLPQVCALAMFATRRTGAAS
jgi:hypothetical protein